MPIYEYKHPTTGEKVEILQAANDVHEFFDESGIQWERVFSSFFVATDIKPDPFNTRQFVDKTSKPGTMGDVWDRSAELSAQRAAQNGGVDPIKEKYKEQYSKKRKGKKFIE